ncbi:portal protein [Arthrobacter phage Qui]|uniref:Portal protein n=1 Tax=Arthrobacter phage Qui TaxID=2603260 RepID=A0A5B8WIC8_9CAUD|nr:portal protein [Arthrobacter phage Qui]QED11517.1 portal protein [Arthrobacter phage Qui]QOC56348.1 portal protein [Arthrobacter phage Paella]
MGKVKDRLMHAFNAFNSEPEADKFAPRGGIYGASYSVRPDSYRRGVGNDKSIVTTIYNRISLDVAAIPIQHVKVDQNGRFVETVNSYLNDCLTLEANLDQSARAFFQDAAMTLFEEGHIALVPINTTVNPAVSSGWDVKDMRVGKIVSWYPKHVRVSVYNEDKGLREEILVLKRSVAIVENPLYTVMNEPSSTLQRLIRKLSLLDSIDEQVGSGKLDVIIQLPYVIKSEAKREQAETRRADLEMQLSGSKYGVAYTDGTERITQLNRPAENNMLKQVEYLTNMLYGQLGITEDVFNGTASEQVMLNYHNRTIEPILSAITQAMKRSFLTKTARTQGQSIEAYRDPFKLVAIGSMADIADKFARNEILTANEIRAGMGIRPSTDAKADQLRNSNMPIADTDGEAAAQNGMPVEGEEPELDEAAEQDAIVNDAFDALEADIDEMIAEAEADVGDE